MIDSIFHHTDRSLKFKLLKNKSTCTWQAGTILDQSFKYYKVVLEIKQSNNSQGSFAVFSKNSCKTYFEFLRHFETDSHNTSCTTQ